MKITSFDTTKLIEPTEKFPTAPVLKNTNLPKTNSETPLSEKADPDFSSTRSAHSQASSSAKSSSTEKSEKILVSDQQSNQSDTKKSIFSRWKNRLRPRR